MISAEEAAETTAQFSIMNTTLAREVEYRIRQAAANGFGEIVMRPSEFMPPPPAEHIVAGVQALVANGFGVEALEDGAVRIHWAASAFGP